MQDRQTLYGSVEIYLPAVRTLSYWGALVTGTAEDPAGEVIQADLAKEMARLTRGRSLAIAEFSVSRVTLWKVEVDASGTPHVQFRWHEWDSLHRWGQFDEARLLDLTLPDEGTPLILARTGQATVEGMTSEDAHRADRAFGIVRDARRHVHEFQSATSVDDLLDAATARLPLPPSLWYELVLLRRTPSGRLEFTAQQLFLPEARRGDSRLFTIRCEQSDDNGTVFAVAARDAVFEFQLVSMASAKVPPGTYCVTATLLRRGRVRFDGLPGRLREDRRDWLDVLSTVPRHADVYDSAHLIVAVEVCGSAVELETRIDRARQLIAGVGEGATGPLSFSLLTYGSHSYDRWIDDKPVTTLAWAETDPAILDRCLVQLNARGPAVSRYYRAAQVECMLAEVARRLGEWEALAAGRPALVTIGDRPAFPHAIDPVSEIIPCPARRDWRRYLRELSEKHAGMAFGAVHGAGDLPGHPADEVWQHLGTDISVGADAFNARDFAVRLGVVPPAAHYLPFPLAIPEGAD
jgi:hypothetical protein